MSQGRERRLPGITDTNRRWWALAAMCIALFMIMLDITVVNVALPAIQRSLRTTTVTLQWVVNSYTLSLAVLLITAGRIGDLFGRRRMFLIGVIVFAAASMAIGLSQSGISLILWRVVQGAGAALLMPATLSIITHLFPPAERGKAIGIWVGVSGMALAVGPLAGGALVQSFGWSSIFFVNPIVAVGALVIALLTVQESRDDTAVRTIDVPGLLTITIGLTALMVGLIQSNTWHLRSAREIGMFMLAIVGIAAFVAVERRHRAPMVDLELFRSRTFVGVIVVGFVAFFALFALLFYTSLYMQNVRGYSPFQTGVRFLPAVLAIIVVSPLAGVLADRLGSRPLIVSGLIMLAGALLWGSSVTLTSGYTKMLLDFVCAGVGLGLTLSPISLAAMNTVPESKAGVAAGVMTMGRMVGGAFGVALLGALMIHWWSEQLNHLMPFLPPGTSFDLINKPPVPKTLEKLALPEQIYDGKAAFVYAYQRTMRVASILPGLGAVLAAMLITNRRPEAAGDTSDGGALAVSLDKPASTLVKCARTH